MAAPWWGTFVTIVAWLGVGVILLALFAPWAVQRMKRKRRCPKCWYDLSHTQGLRCSECGYAAKRERKLYKARKRWGVAWLGVFLMLGAYALHVTPGVRERGWVAAVPTTVLITALPWLSPDFDVVVSRMLPRMPTTPTVDPSWNTRLYQDLLARTQQAAPPLSSFHRSYLLLICRWQSPDLDHAESIYSDLLSEVIASTRWMGGRRISWRESRLMSSTPIPIATRTIWPVGVPIYVSGAIEGYTPAAERFVVHAPELDDSAQWKHPIARMVTPKIEARHIPDLAADYTRYLGRAGREVDSLRLRYSYRIGESCREIPALTREREIRVVESTLHTRIQGGIDDILAPVRDQELDDLLQRSLNPRLVMSHPSYFLRVHLLLGLTCGDLQDFYDDADGITFAMRIDVFMDDDVVARGVCLFRCSRGRRYGDFSVVGLEWDDDWDNWLRSLSAGRTPWSERKSLLAARDEQGKIFSIRLRGDGALALLDAGAERYWHGEVWMPLAIGSQSANSDAAREEHE